MQLRITIDLFVTKEDLTPWRTRQSQLLEVPFPTKASKVSKLILEATRMLLAKVFERPGDK